MGIFSHQLDSFILILDLLLNVLFVLGSVYYVEHVIWIQRSISYFRNVMYSLECVTVFLMSKAHFPGEMQRAG